MLRVFGTNLRKILVHSMRNRFTAALSGIGVTALVQSSTATSLMTSSFVGQGLVTLPAALAVMRGADVGTALMSVLFSADLSWLSPLFIFVGVVLFITQSASAAGRVGRVLIGLGLMLLALQLVVQATGPLFSAPAMRRDAGLAQQRRAARNHHRRRAGDPRLLEPGGGAAGGGHGQFQRGAARRGARAWCSAPISAAACWRC